MKICETNKCTGCLLCETVCTKKAISLKVDGQGFWYPEVDEKLCRQCGLCQKKCPVNYAKPHKGEKAFAAYAKDKGVRERSSSGGIFRTLAEEIISKGGAVFGAGFDGELNVLHKCAEKREELAELMGSKYVQSNTLGIYEKVIKMLDSGRPVLFCGTPCQCAAVANIAGDREGLYLVDFLCHGVPSPKLWRKYLDEGFSNPSRASFRNKKRGWQEFSMEVEDEKGVYNCSQYKDPYLRLFLKNIALRPSCYECVRKGEEYCSDITVADFWGISKVFPSMNDDKGCSAVILRSDKGKELLERVSQHLEIKECSIEDIRKTNIAYDNSAKPSPKREEFMTELEKDTDFKDLKSKYYQPVSGKEIFSIRIKRSAKKMLCKVYKLKKKGT